MDHLADFAPMVQMLDLPEAQTVDQLEDVLTLFDTSVPEQVIEVPKISCPSRPLRAALAATQMTEQWVKVPTDVVLVVPRQLVEWFDIPVPGARGSSGNGGLQGFFPEQSFPHSSVEQIVDIPVPGGGLQDFLPDQASEASSAVLPEERFQGGFSNFPPGEKGAKVTRQSSARVHGHSSSSELSTHKNSSWRRSSSRLRPRTISAALLGGLQSVFPGHSSTRGVRLSDAAARWQALDPGSEFWPKRACRYFLPRRLPTL